MEDKLYYSIKEVADEIGVTYATLRFWEKEFKGLRPFRNKRGVRLYTKNEIEFLKTICYLTKTCGYTIEGAKTWLKDEKNKDADSLEVIDTLIQMKRFLLNIKSNLKSSAIKAKQTPPQQPAIVEEQPKIEEKVETQQDN